MVQLYFGGFRTVKKSGVGQAILHQEKVLEKMNLKITKKYRKSAKVIHINTVFPDSVAAAIKAKMRRQRVVYYAHSTEEDFRSSFNGSNLLAPIFKKWIMFCYGLGDLVITPTMYSKNILQGYGLKKPIYAVSNGIDTDYFKPNIFAKKRLRAKYHLNESNKIVISVGHYIERKGILEFISIAKEMPSVTFIWFGFTDERLISKKVTKCLQEKPENLILAGYVNQEELRTAYQGADAFIFMSHEETEGIVVLEALASEIPVILKDIPVYNCWLMDGRQVCKFSNNTEAANKIWQVLENPNVDMKREGRKIAMDRSFMQVAKQLKEIYRKESLYSFMEDIEVP